MTAAVFSPSLERQPNLLLSAPREEAQEACQEGSLGPVTGRLRPRASGRGCDLGQRLGWSRVVGTLIRPFRGENTGEMNLGAKRRQDTQNHHESEERLGRGWAAGGRGSW